MIKSAKYNGYENRILITKIGDSDSEFKQKTFSLTNMAVFKRGSSSGWLKSYILNAIKSYDL